MNIAIIDDHLLFSQSLGNVLQQSIAGSTVKTFASGTDFLSTDFNQWHPDIALSDILMPGIDGVAMFEKAQLLLGDSCKFILTSSITDVYTVKDAMRKGIKGYVSKDAPLSEMLAAIETVMGGKQYVSDELKENLLSHIFEDDQIVFQLSPKEKEVLQRICGGRTPKEIAYDMKLSIHTVQQYHKSVMRKFKVNRTTDLVVFAIQKGLYNPLKR